MKKNLFLIIILSLFSCKKDHKNDNFENHNNEVNYNLASKESEESIQEEEEEEESNWDGSFCANVQYYNPNTGTKSNYTLTIEVSNNELIQLNWPNGGYLDDFYGVIFNQVGFAEFTSDKGYEYEVQIIGETTGCFDDVRMAEQCNGITEDGDQCENVTDNYSGYCWQHENQY